MVVTEKVVYSYAVNLLKRMSGKLPFTFKLRLWKLGCVLMIGYTLHLRSYSVHDMLSHSTVIVM